MNDRVEIQDNVRENELLSLFKLKKTNNNRIGIDAKLTINQKVFDFELKSTTGTRVSTASPLHLKHLNKWRTCHWLIGVYKKNATLDYCVYGSPNDMKEWIDYWYKDISRGITISDMIVDRIDIDMVYGIFGNKKCYSLEDAKFVYKGLYSIEDYKKLQDMKDGYSQSRMLAMFKEHNKTYLYRGAAVNNPKITKNIWGKWKIIKSNYAEELRTILKENYGK